MDTKNLVFGSLALIFLLALAWCLAELNKKPAESVLDRVAADPETRFIVAIKENAPEEVFLADGSPAKECGNVNRAAKVEGDCNINGRVTKLNTLNIITTQSSPGCTHVYNGAGYLLYKICS